MWWISQKIGRLSTWKGMYILSPDSVSYFGSIKILATRLTIYPLAFIHFKGMNLPWNILDSKASPFYDNGPTFAIFSHLSESSTGPSAVITTTCVGDRVTICLLIAADTHRDEFGWSQDMRSRSLFQILLGPEVKLCWSWSNDKKICFRDSGPSACSTWAKICPFASSVSQ